MKTFKSKLRSQIRKPLKEGLRASVGGIELLDDFYRVFSVNMRDLGSPVHSKKLMRRVIEEFPSTARVVLVYRGKEPMACSLVIGFGDTLKNPWASSLREYSVLSPNMLLYSTMLDYACDNNYRFFDFGRSSPNEGTYRFKEQWGAKPTPLHWYYISIGSEESIKGEEKARFERVIHYWKRLPVPLTKIVGPSIRKHIGL
ncbi:MAG: GNAT family N-acetyltransferase [bacterium]|nr:GNAT family N-acetyltransferase [bacterium]